MDIARRLQDYVTQTFTDQDVTNCGGISVRMWRELLKLGAVRTSTNQRGRGRSRKCDAVTFKRVAMVGAINRAGLSTAVSGQIAYWLPLGPLLDVIWDPAQALGAWINPVRKLPAVLRPNASWLKPGTPARTGSETDWSVEIYERRFVGVVFGTKANPCIFGDLRDDGTRFVRWFGSRYVRSASDEFKRVWQPHNISDFVAYWERASTFADGVDLGFLGLTYENHDAKEDALRREAYSVARSPVFKTTINVSLAIRTALRRYFGVEPPLATTASTPT